MTAAIKHAPKLHGQVEVIQQRDAGSTGNFELTVDGTDTVLHSKKTTGKHIDADALGDVIKTLAKMVEDAGAQGDQDQDKDGGEDETTAAATTK